MTSERQWTPGKIALVGGGVVAIGWIAYKLLTSNPPPAVSHSAVLTSLRDSDF